MTRKEQIRSAYKLTGGHASFYDGMMTYSTLPGKAICRLVWNMDREKNLRYVEQALSGVPEDFAGKLLEVPVGTGVLTMPIYKELPRAEITCLDYSADMMNAARRKAEATGIRNIRIINGHTGWTDEPDFAFLHRTELCKPFTKKYVDPAAPYDGYVEDDDTEERARTVRLGKVGKK